MVVAQRLSRRQAEMLTFIRGYIDRKGYAPTMRDIQRGCDVSSTSVVNYNLLQMEKKGYLRRERESSRAIEIVSKRPKMVRVPIVGMISPGAPIPIPDPEALRRWYATH